MNIENDPRFTRLPERFIAEIARHDPTGTKGGVTWHEVVFRMDDGITCQCAVVNGVYVPKGIGMERFVEIAKVWQASELGG